jgi:hypothetical protein
MRRHRTSGKVAPPYEFREQGHSHVEIAMDTTLDWAPAQRMLLAFEHKIEWRALKETMTILQEMKIN